MLFTALAVILAAVFIYHDAPPQTYALLAILVAMAFGILGRIRWHWKWLLVWFAIFGAIALAFDRLPFLHHLIR